MSEDAFHDRLLAIVLRLPGAYEDRPWGSVHCKVDGKIFVGWSRTAAGRMSVGLRVPVDEQGSLVDHDARFTIAKYSGRYGGVDMLLDTKPDWAEVERYIVGSYRLVASKKRVKELDAAPAPTAKKKAAVKKAPVVKKAPATKPRR